MKILPPRVNPVLAAVLVIGGLLTARCRAQAAPAANADTLAVAAVGTFQADPDTAVIQIDIRGRSQELKTAYAQARRQAVEVRQLLRRQGIAAAQAELGAYQVQPNIDWRTNKLVDYSVVARVRVELTDFSKIGPLVNAAGEAGLPAIQGVSFELKDMAAARARAIADAYRQAYTEAAELARLAGRGIARLRSASLDVNQPGPVYPRPMMMARAAGAPAPAPTEGFRPEKITVTARIQATYVMSAP